MMVTAVVLGASPACRVLIVSRGASSVISADAVRFRRTLIVGTEKQERAGGPLAWLCGGVSGQSKIACMK